MSEWILFACKISHRVRGEYSRKNICRRASMPRFSSKNIGPYPANLKRVDPQKVPAKVSGAAANHMGVRSGGDANRLRKEP